MASLMKIMVALLTLPGRETQLQMDCKCVWGCVWGGVALVCNKKSISRARNLSGDFNSYGVWLVLYSSVSIRQKGNLTFILQFRKRRHSAGTGSLKSICHFMANLTKRAGLL